MATLTELAERVVWERRRQHLKEKGELRGGDLSEGQKAWLRTRGLEKANQLLGEAILNADGDERIAAAYLRASMPMERGPGRPVPLMKRAFNRVRERERADRAHARRALADRAEPDPWVGFVMGLKLRLYLVARHLRQESSRSAVLLLLRREAKANGMQGKECDYLNKVVPFNSIFVEEYNRRRPHEQLSLAAIRKKFERKNSKIPIILPDN